MKQKSTNMLNRINEETNKYEYPNRINEETNKYEYAQSNKRGRLYVFALHLLDNHSIENTYDLLCLSF